MYNCGKFQDFGWKYYLTTIDITYTSSFGIVIDKLSH